MLGEWVMVVAFFDRFKSLFNGVDIQSEGLTQILDFILEKSCLKSMSGCSRIRGNNISSVSLLNSLAYRETLAQGVVPPTGLARFALFGAKACCVSSCALASVATCCVECSASVAANVTPLSTGETEFLEILCVCLCGCVHATVSV